MPVCCFAQIKDLVNSGAFLSVYKRGSLVHSRSLSRCTDTAVVACFWMCSLDGNVSVLEVSG